MATARECRAHLGQAQVCVLLLQPVLELHHLQDARQPKPFQPLGPSCVCLLRIYDSEHRPQPKQSQGILGVSQHLQ